jgi:hypothetical protein
MHLLENMIYGLHERCGSKNQRHFITKAVEFQDSGAFSVCDDMRFAIDFSARVQRVDI